MRILSLFLFVASIQAVSAQQVDWLTAGTVDYSLNPEMPDQVLASAPGHLVAMRQTTIPFIHGQKGYGQAILEELDPANGEQGWVCMLFDSVNVTSAAVGTNGKAYFAGSFMGDLGLCDGSILGGVPGQSPFFENHFIVAVDLNSGFIEWMRNVSLAHDQATGIASMAIDPNGDLWYAFSEWGIAKVVRVNATGNDVEERIIDGARVIGTISFDQVGGLYVSGSCDNGGFAFGGSSYQNTGTTGYSMFVLRYRADGSAGFVEFADDVTFHDPTVVATSDGHAYLAGALLLEGTSWGGIQFNGPDWVYATFIAKLDSTGQFLWGVESDQAGGPIVGDLQRSKGPCVAVDANDAPYLFGNLRGQVDWGNGVVSDGITLGARSMTVVSFAPDGTPQWEATSFPSGIFNTAQTITALAEGDAIHFAGHIQGEFRFPPLMVGDNLTQSAMVGRVGGIPTAVQDRTSAEGLFVWPNPARERLYVEVASSRNVGGVLVNSAGQWVRSFILVPGHNAIDVSAQVPGLYLLRLADGRALRVVVE